MRKALVLLLIATLAVVMIGAVMQLPQPGAADTPVHRHVSAYYIDGGPAAGGADNLVTAVLLNYRAVDTFGEVVVIFTALLAVLAAASLAAPDPLSGKVPTPRSTASVPVSPVVSFIVGLMAPFIATFALFVMLKGHVLPGGGFQGGMVLGAMLILLTVFVPGAGGTALVPARAVFWIRAAGPLVFALVALIGIVVSGWLFGMPSHPAVREAMMIALELGIGIGGAAVLIGLFRAIEEE